MDMPASDQDVNTRKKGAEALSLRILLVEDNEHDVLAFQRIHKRSDYHWDVTHCIRAEDALKQIRSKESKFDVVLADLGLPGMSGLEMFQELLKNDPSAALVLITGAGSEEVAVEALKSGVHEYIIKDPSQGYLDMLPILLPEAVRRFQDRQARTQAEEALRNSEEQYKKLYQEAKRAEELYQSLLNSSADAIIICDLKGKIQYANSAFTEIFGWTMEEIKEIQIPILPDAEKKSTKELIKKLSTNGVPSSASESKRQTKDGRLLNVSISASRYDDHEGKPSGILVILRDITQQKKLQAQLLHAQKMESIGTMASGVAHNFRNILAGISVNNQLIQVKNTENQDLMEISEEVSDAVEKGSQLVERLMQFATKQTEKEYKILNLSQVIQGVYELIRKSFDKKYQLEVKHPESISVMGDHSDISQVIMNLCINARDAMPDGGRLRIDARVRGGKAIINVSDTGSGMSKEALEKCFDPFFTTKGPGEGTGLGLSTSYGIIKDHGGDIHVYSETGKGTTFRIYLPIAKPKKEKKEKTVHDLVHGQGQRILIVDDGIHLLKPMEKLLKSLGYQAETVDSGEKAVSKYISWKPEVVLLDRNMPDLDGIACASKIIEKDPEARIILMSGYDEDGPNGIDPQIKKIIAGYLTKPFDIVELVQRLVKLLNIKS
jgi:two-component system cell cycle sensor histidine kinase/response regulator CckA